jgi:hypothetical protein
MKLTGDFRHLFQNAHSNDNDITEMEIQQLQRNITTGGEAHSDEKG